MLLYNCPRHGRVQVIYLELGILAPRETVVVCPGGKPEHTMVLDADAPEKSKYPPNTQTVRARGEDEV